MSGSTYQQMSIFQGIINNQTAAIISGTNTGNYIEKILENLTQSYTQQMNAAIDSYNKAANQNPPDSNGMEAASLLFNKLQTMFQSSTSITTGAQQKVSSFIGTLTSAQQNTLTSTSYLSMMLQYLTALLK